MPSFTLHVFTTNRFAFLKTGSLVLQVKSFSGLQPLVGPSRCYPHTPGDRPLLTTVHTVSEAMCQQRQAQSS